MFTGKWRFSVTDVGRAATYKQRLRTGYRKEVAAGEGSELLLVTCRVRNGTKTKDTLVLEKGWDGMNTALTDAESHSYEPLIYDARFNESAPDGASFLPGAAIDFVIVFDVPKGTQPKDLVFTAMRYDDRAKFDQPKRPPTDIRYSLVK